LNRSELRAQVFERDNNTCIWPQCFKPADEMMHFTSRGMGGSKYRDTMGNNGAGCWSHARMSDGEYGDGGSESYREAHLLLLGPRYLEMDVGVIAFERAEALKALIKERHE